MNTRPDGGREIGLDAKVELSTSIPAGASAKGLRLSFDPKWAYKGLSFDGIGVHFTIPKVLEFKGELAMKGQGDQTAFEGAVKVKLFPIDAFVDGQVRFGTELDTKGNLYKYFAIKLDLELSKGIKIFNTGLSLYGMTGLFAYNYAPKKGDDQKWFAIDGSGWLQQAPAGCAELSKWAAAPDKLAFGAGVTVATNADDGKPFNGKFILLVTLPGPVVFLEGRANLMKDRKELNNDAAFRAYTVFDGLAGTALFGLDAKWRYPEGGELIDVAGSSEAFFDFHDTAKWYVKVGLENPPSARVKAKLVSFLEADAFLLVDANHARTGGKAGFSKALSYGPLDVGVQIWLSAVADISWSPPQLQAQAAVAGAFWAKAFGYGLSGSVTAAVQVDAWRPFRIAANATATGKIPFYGTFSKSVALQWTQPPNTAKGAKPIATATSIPRLAAPLATVSAAHALVPTVWPLQLQPALADASGMLAEDWTAKSGFDFAAPPPADAPVLPLDARLDLTFARPVADAALVGINGSAKIAPDVIGNPNAKGGQPAATVAYALHTLELARWDALSAKWVVVAAQAAGAGGQPLATGYDKLYGAWIPELGAAGLVQQRLRLWAVDPLEALASPSGVQAWQAADSTAAVAAFTEPTNLTLDVVFNGFDAGAMVPVALKVGADMPLFAWADSLQGSIGHVEAGGTTAVGLCVAAKPQLPLGQSSDDLWSAIESDAHMWNSPPPPSAPVAPLVVVAITLSQAHVTQVTLQLCGAHNVAVVALNSNNVPVAAANWTAGHPPLVLAGNGIAKVNLMASTAVALVGLTIHYAKPGTQGLIPGGSGPSIANFAAKLELLKAPAHVLPANAQLRLSVQLAVTQTPNPALGKAKTAILTQVAHFRTGSGPGLANLSVPSSNGAVDPLQGLTDTAGQLVTVTGNPTTTPSLRSPLNHLAPYVLAAWPPTPGPGEPTQMWRSVDVGFDFRVGNVRELFLAGQRDLGVRVRDRSGAWLRDGRGRRVPTSLNWLAPEAKAADGNQQKLLQQWKAATGLAIDDKLLGLKSRLRWQGPLLPPTAGLMAELVPLLLSAPLAATGATPAGWTAAAVLGADPGTWVVDESLNALRPILGGAKAKADQALAAGAALVWAGVGNQPDQSWTDFAVTTLVITAAQPGDMGWVGVVARCSADCDAGLLFAVHLSQGWRRLVKLGKGATATLLAEDRGGTAGAAVVLTLEVNAGRVLASCGEDNVFDVAAPAVLPASGSVALYASASSGAGFHSVSVEDLSESCPILCRHSFATGAAATLAHLAATAPIDPELPSKLPEKWSAPTQQPDLATAISNPKNPQPPLPAESANCRALFAAAAGEFATLRSPRAGLQSMQWVASDKRKVLLLRSSENLDWRRTTLQLLRSPLAPWPQMQPDGARLGAGTWQGQRLTALDVTVLDGSLGTGATVEVLGVGDPLNGPDREGPSFVLAALSGPAGVLWRERFDNRSLDLWRSNDVTQNTFIAAASTFQLPLAPTTAVVLSPAAPVADVRVAATLAQTSGQLGIVLRHGAADSAGSGKATRLEVVFAPKSGTESAKLTLTQAYLDNKGSPATKVVPLALPPQTQGPLQFEVVAVGGTVAVFVNRTLCGLYQDPKPQPGACGLVAVGCVGGQCTAFDVSTADAPVVRKLSGALDPAAVGSFTSWQPDKPAPSWAAETLPASAALPGLAGSTVPLEQASTTQSAVLAVPNQLVVANAPAVGSAEAPKAGAVLVLPDSTPTAGAPQDWVLSVDLCIDGDWAAGVAMQWRDNDNATLFSACVGPPQPRLVRYEDSKLTAIGSQALQVGKGIWSRLLVRVRQGRATFWHNGVHMAACQLPMENSGSLALFATGGTKTCFANVALLDVGARIGGWQPLGLPENADYAPTEPTGSWALTSRGLMPTLGNAPVQTQWVTVGDAAWDDYAVTANVRIAAGAPGALTIAVRWVDADCHLAICVTSQEIKVRSHTLESIKDLKTLTALAAGAAHELVVLVAGSRLRVRVAGTTALDTLVAGPTGGGCAVGFAGTGPAWLDGFVVRPATAQERADWTIASGGTKLVDWAAVLPGSAKEGPAAWTRTAGEIVQTSNAYLDDPDQPAEQTPAIAMRGPVLWAGAEFGNTWRVSVDISSADDDPIGLQLGTAPNDANWVRFSLDAQRKVWRVVRKLGSTFAELWSTAAGYTSKAIYRVALAKDGDGLRGWVDGVPAFWLPGVIEPLPHIGLYCWANSGARFDNVAISTVPDRRATTLFRDTFGWYNAGMWGAADDSFTWANHQLIANAPPATAVQRAMVGRSAWKDYRVTAVLRRKVGSCVLVIASNASTELQLTIALGGTWHLAVVAMGTAKQPPPVASGTAATLAAVDVAVTWTVEVYHGCVCVRANGQLLIAKLLANENLTGKVGWLAPPGSEFAVLAMAVEQANWQPIASIGPGGLAAGVVAVAATPGVPNAPASSVAQGLAQVAGAAWPRTGPNAVQLRDGNGDTAHATWLDDPGPAVPADAALLRSADGSLAALLEPVTQAWDAWPGRLTVSTTGKSDGPAGAVAVVAM